MIGAHVIYHDVPAEVSHISAYQWRQAAPPAPLSISIARNGIETTITFVVVQPLVVVLQRADGTYLIDGPMVPREDAADRQLGRVWRRTIAGVVSGVTASAPQLDWLSEIGMTGGAWPSCWWASGSRWECMGVPVDETGVLLGREAGRLLSAAVSGESTPVLRPSAWGRLALVGDRDGGPAPRVRFIAARPVAPSQRQRAVRLETALITDLRVKSLTPGVFWIAGDSSPPGGWLEIRSARSGPEYLDLGEVAGDAPQLPLRIQLEERRDVSALVVSTRGDPVPGAQVTAFRLIDPQAAATSSPESPPPRRVLATESTSAADGTVEIGGLGEADYEIVVWHPQLGRASVRLAPDAVQITVRLQAPGVARGRVMAEGKPLGGVDVFSAPDPGTYASAVDPIDLKGGDARTGPDGRFSIALAPGGGGELRVGGGPYAVMRVPLPHAALPLVELGDIELGRGLSVSVALDQDPGCDLLATGPVGKTGLHIVNATRTGPGLFSVALPEEGSWEFVLMCGRVERTLTPSIVAISTGSGPHEVHLIVR
jgi:hypothetical protein